MSEPDGEEELEEILDRDLAEEIRVDEEIKADEVPKKSYLMLFFKNFRYCSYSYE